MAVNLAKQNSAVRCVDNHCTSNQLIGLGSGSTIVYAIQRLGELFRSNQISGIHCVPSSSVTKSLIVEQGLPLTTLIDHPTLDVYIDGADEADSNLNCIKGGGGCLTQEKIVMSRASKFYIVADRAKLVNVLGHRWKYVPIEVIKEAWYPVKLEIEKRELGVVQLRKNKDGTPYVTDNQCYIVNWEFPEGTFGVPHREESPEATQGATPVSNLIMKALNTRILTIPGVVETGLFVGNAEMGYFGNEQGEVEVVKVNVAESNGWSHANGVEK